MVLCRRPQTMFCRAGPGGPAASLARLELVDGFRSEPYDGVRNAALILRTAIAVPAGFPDVLRIIIRIIHAPGGFPRLRQRRSSTRLR
jgi:hypothetical protein